MLDLNEVAMFVEVVRAGSFAEAARRLGTPPNRISRRIQQLETRLGSRLLQRSTRKLALTFAGQMFYDHCANAVGELTKAGQALLDAKALPSGLIRVTAPANFFDFFSMQWMMEFLDLYPLVRIEFILNDANVDLIEEHIDVAFRDVANASDISRNLLFRPSSALVASPAYLAARGAPDTPAALANHDCLPLLGRPGPVTWRLDGPGGVSEVSVTGRFGANTAGAVLQAALEGLGIALLPAALTVPPIRAGRLVPVLADYRRASGGLGGGLYAVLPSRQQVPPAVSAFVAFAAERLAAIDGAADCDQPVAQ